MDYKEKIIETELKILDIFVSFCKKNDLTYFLYGGTLLGAARHKGMIPWDDDIDISMPRTDFNKLLELSHLFPDNVYLDYYTTNKLYWLPFAKIRLKNTIYLESFLKDSKMNSEFWIDIFPLDYCNDDLNIAKIKKEKIWRYSNLLALKAHVQSQKKENLKRSFLKMLIIFIPRKLIISLRNKYFKNNDSTNYYMNYGSKYKVEKQLHLIDEYYPASTIIFEGKKYNCPKNIDYVLKKIYGNDYMELPPLEKRVNHNPSYIKFEDGEVVDFYKDTSKMI